MIGDEIGLTGHLLPGVVDIGDRGLPTHSHGKMREVIGYLRFPVHIRPAGRGAGVLSTPAPGDGGNDTAERQGGSAGRRTAGTWNQSAPELAAP